MKSKLTMPAKIPQTMDKVVGLVAKKNASITTSSITNAGVGEVVNKYVRMPVPANNPNANQPNEKL